MDRPKKFRKRALLLMLACLAWGGRAQADMPFAKPKVMNRDGVHIVYDQERFPGIEVQYLPRLTNRENGTDIPLEVFPKRMKIMFLPRPGVHPSGNTGAAFSENTITVIPLTDATQADFKEAYPGLVSQALRLDALLKKPRALPKNRREIPDLFEVDCEREIISKVQFLDFPAGSGVFFITQYAQEFELIQNNRLTCVLQGLTEDRRYYIDARFSIGHPTLDRSPGMTRPWPKAKQKKYLGHIEEELDYFPESSFRLPLEGLKAMLESIAIDPSRQPAR